MANSRSGDGEHLFRARRPPGRRRLGLVHPAEPGTDGPPPVWCCESAEPHAPEEGGMAAARLVMRKAREILRQKWEPDLSHRKVARSLGVGVATISETLTRELVAGVGTW